MFPFIQPEPDDRPMVLHGRVILGREFRQLTRALITGVEAFLAEQTEDGSRHEPDQDRDEIG